MLTTMDLSRQKTAVLENAYSVSYDKAINELWTASFSLPADDPKNSKVNALQFVEIEHDDTGDKVGLFRVMPKQLTKNINTEETRYELEHVAGTLLGSVLFKYHQINGYNTRQVLEWLLNRQKVKHWILGECDFNLYMDYSWENENLLSALFSVPKTFPEPYMWTYDTTSYPWKINLKKIPTQASCRIAEGYNLTGLSVEENPNGLWNRIYPLGAGEGVNQVDIRKVNGGLDYIEDTQSITKYGLYETVFVDREITDEKTLLALAKKKLKEWKDVLISWSVSAADLSELSGLTADRLRLGEIVKIYLDDIGEQDLLIVKESKGDLFGRYDDIKLELGNRIDTFIDSSVEQMRRQQVTDLYSQGATNILNFGYQDNCDQNIPAVIPFFIDDDVVNVNTAELTFESLKFRAYSSTTAGGGATVGTTATDGGVAITSESGGGTTETTSTVSAHTHLLMQEITDAGLADELRGQLADRVYQVAGGYINTKGSPGNLSLIGNAGEHTHSVTVPAHTHNVSVPNHRHNLTLDAHTHAVNHEIIELDTLPSAVQITVDDNIVPDTAIKQDRLDIVPYLKKDSSGKVTRGKHKITIKPNGLARIEANLILRVFIQSQLGGKY